MKENCFCSAGLGQEKTNQAKLQGWPGRAACVWLMNLSSGYCPPLLQGIGMGRALLWVHSDKGVQAGGSSEVTKASSVIKSLHLRGHAIAHPDPCLPHLQVQTISDRKLKANDCLSSEYVQPFYYHNALSNSLSLMTMDME